jgi:drug/metabolite transporter (DMT)-like permease
MWAWLLLGEQISASQVPGMVLVMLGLVLVVWTSQRAAARPERVPAPAAGQ